jgi:hypothetical protein
MCIKSIAIICLIIIGFGCNNLNIRKNKLNFIDTFNKYDSIDTYRIIDSLKVNYKSEMFDICNESKPDDEPEIENCTLIPFKGYKFDWNNYKNDKISDYTKYLILDNNYLLFSTVFNNQICAFTSSNRRSNNWMLSGSYYYCNLKLKNADNFFKAFFKAKSYSEHIFLIRYMSSHIGFAFFKDNVIKVITVYYGKIELHENFNEWASKLSKTPYE